MLYFPPSLSLSLSLPLFFSTCGAGEIMTSGFQAFQSFTFHQLGWDILLPLNPFCHPLSNRKSTTLAKSGIANTEPESHALVSIVVEVLRSMWRFLCSVESLHTVSGFERISECWICRPIIGVRMCRIPEFQNEAGRLCLNRSGNRHLECRSSEI